MATMKKVQVEARMGTGFTMESKIHNHTVYIDQPRSAGGEDKGPTPLEMLLLSLAGCFGAIARIMANQRRINLRGMDISVEGELDVEVLLGKTQDKRSGFGQLKVVARIDADMTREEKEKFLHEVERRCPVSDNIMQTTPISIEVAE